MIFQASYFVSGRQDLNRGSTAFAMDQAISPM